MTNPMKTKLWIAWGMFSVAAILGIALGSIIFAWINAIIAAIFGWIAFFKYS